MDATLEDLGRSLGAAEQTLGEAAIDIANRVDALDTDPQSLAATEERFSVLSDLKRKYGSTLDDVLGFGKEMSERSSELTDLLDSADAVASELASSRDRLSSLGDALSSARETAGQRLVKHTVLHLKDLGFRDPLLEVGIEPVDPGPTGLDRVRLAFASDQRLPTGEIGRVASGGELSRLVLALRLAGGSGEVETLVFDEIDAGVGGATAIEVGKKLSDLAKSRQVLCVTHLPQVAAFATDHYRIERIDATATLARVDEDERILEIARMLSGAPDGMATREAAVELLESARACW